MRLRTGGPRARLLLPALAILAACTPRVVSHVPSAATFHASAPSHRGSGASEDVQVVRERVASGLRGANLFADVVTDATPNLRLETEVQAFCGRGAGFIYLRIAGITKIRFRLVRGDRVLYDRTIERIVTDVDPEYTGSQIGTIRGALLHVMADSLRETIDGLLVDLDERRSAWSNAAAPS